MPIVKKYYQQFSAACFFIFAFVFSLRPLLDFDLWFDLKSGEVFSKMGIIHYDVFSYTEDGKPWFPYEWLFQIVVYWIHQVSGLVGIQIFVSLLVVVQLFLFYGILRKILNLSILKSIFVCLFFFGSVFDFYVARPFILAYPLLTLNLFLILLYYFKKKNILWITLPATLIWANLHGSIFLDIFFFGAYGAVAFFEYLISRNKEWLSKSKTLFLYLIPTSILTILPPLGTIQYQLLWKFFQDRSILTKYIAEWTPLSSDQLAFAIYSAVVILFFGLLGIIFLKGRKYQEFLWLLPLLPLTYSAYLAGRNAYLGYFALALILGFVLKKTGVKFFILMAFAVSLYSGFLLQQKIQSPKLYYPVNAVNFIKAYHLNGNMFNEYAYGGYLLYKLYPQQKVFIDGRSDVYIDNLMPETLKISTNKNLPDDKFRIFMYKSFFDKYDISFAILRTEKNTVLRKIARVLQNDHEWSLVLWDDTTQLFVRKDGKNDGIIKEFGTTAATPYLDTLYRSGNEQKALTEYVRMQALIPSAHTSNAIGFILLQKGQYDEAQQKFLEATKEDPTFESPFMNLAELAAKNGDLNSAISLYQKAEELAPNRGLIYIRLGQLTLEKTGDLNLAKQIWSDGIKNIPSDDPTKHTLSKLISGN